MIESLILVALLAHRRAPTLSELDSMAQARDFRGISQLVDNLPKNLPNPLQVLQTNGAYQCGQYGWRAHELKGLGNGDRSYVVLSTPLTSEDIGDFLFERVDGRLHLIPEDESLGVHFIKHQFDVTFNISEKRAVIQDRLTLNAFGHGAFVFRMSNEFRVRKIADSSGKEIPFTQGGGIVLIEKFPNRETTLDIDYDGLVDRPLYAGSITNKEATLTNCYWYPMVARQPVPYRVTVHYPKDWIAIGQGVKVSEAPGRTTYRMDLPCIFYSLSAGPYATGSYEHDRKTFYAWSPRLSKEVLEAQAETYASIVEFYSRFSPFPFKTYGGLDSLQYGGGALEAYSYATYGGGFPMVDAHEPSHTWWGGILDNTYLHSFWNESFAVYSDGLYHREWTGSDGNRLAFIPEGEVDAAYDQIACDRSGADRGPIGSALGYGKGSHVLFLLEKIVGREGMIRSMHRFIVRQPSEKSAEWEDFEIAAEAENPGKNLKTFFADWLQRPGHLEMSAKASYEWGKVRVEYSPLGRPYRIPLEVMLIYRNGRTLTRTFDVRGATTLTLDSSEKPDVVSVDPYRFLIRKVQTNEEPLEFDRLEPRMTAYVDPSHQDWARQSGRSSKNCPTDLANALLIGSPETFPQMKALCEKAGFKVRGASLSYHGRTIDLEHGGAEALVDLGRGRTCAISLGKSRIPASVGSSKVAIYDDLGRLLDGETMPKTKGAFTFRF
jgi:hypothetical protein